MGAVAIVVKEFPPDRIGGTETQTRRMASALQDRGHEVTVFTKRYGNHDDSDVNYNTVRITNLDWFPFISDLTFILVCLFALVRHRNEYDHLQCMMIHPVGFMGYLVHRLTGVPYFTWIRGNDFYAAKEIGWKRRIIRRVLSDTLILVQSSDIEADVRSEFPDLDPAIGIVGNGVTVPNERAALNSSTVLYLGRLAPKKGVEYLIRAMAELNETNATLRIVGDGDRRDDLEELANSLGIDAQFKGFVHPDDVCEHYREASIFVLPSTEGEGMPNAVLEAMAWGIPVVATNSGSLPTLIEDGTRGYIVPMRDSEALKDVIECLLGNPDKRKEIGNTGRRYVRENHSWDVVCSELEAYYIGRKTFTK